MREPLPEDRLPSFCGQEGEVCYRPQVDGFALPAGRLWRAEGPWVGFLAHHEGQESRVLLWAGVRVVASTAGRYFLSEEGLALVVGRAWGLQTMQPSFSVRTVIPPKSRG